MMMIRTEHALQEQYFQDFKSALTREILSTAARFERT